MAMPEFETYIEFARSQKSRQQLKDFEKYCRHQAILRKSFRRVVGRKFVFAFPTAADRDEFQRELAEMLRTNGAIAQRTVA